MQRGPGSFREKNLRPGRGPRDFSRQAIGQDPQLLKVNFLDFALPSSEVFHCEFKFTPEKVVVGRLYFPIGKVAFRRRCRSTSGGSRFLVLECRFWCAWDHLWLINLPLPPGKKTLIRPYSGKPMVNKPLIKALFLGTSRGGRLISHE